MFYRNKIIIKIKWCAFLDFLILTKQECHYSQTQHQILTVISKKVTLFNLMKKLKIIFKLYKDNTFVK